MDRAADTYSKLGLSDWPVCSRCGPQNSTQAGELSVQDLALAIRRRLGQTPSSPQQAVTRTTHRMLLDDIARHPSIIFIHFSYLSLTGLRHLAENAELQLACLPASGSLAPAEQLRAVVGPPCRCTHGGYGLMSLEPFPQQRTCGADIRQRVLDNAIAVFGRTPLNEREKVTIPVGDTNPTRSQQRPHRLVSQEAVLTVS